MLLLLLLLLFDKNGLVLFPPLFPIFKDELKAVELVFLLRKGLPLLLLLLLLFPLKLGKGNELLLFELLLLLVLFDKNGLVLV